MKIYGNGIISFSGDGNIHFYKKQIYHFNKKIISFYRNGCNDVGNPIIYRVVSGNMDPSNSTAIKIVNDSVPIDPNYPFTMYDRNGKIWVSVTFKFDSGELGDDSYLYTYPASVNSWNGGWDYWYYPNGTIAGSANNANPGVGTGGTHTGITWSNMRSNNAGPIFVSDTKSGYYGLGYGTIMPNGYPIHVALSGNNGDMSVWTFNGNDWGHSLYLPSSETHTTKRPINSNRAGIIATSSNLLLIYGKGGYLYGRTSTDNGNTWNSATVLSTYDVSNPASCWSGFLGACPGNRVYSDEYARFIVERTSSYPSRKDTNPKSGSYWIFKVDTSDLANGTHISSMVYPSGTGSPWSRRFNQGVYYNNWIAFTLPWWSSNTLPTVTYGNQGDPRNIFYLNESTMESGMVAFDRSGGTYSNEYRHATHCGGGIRVDSHGTWWAVGSGYLPGSREKDGLNDNTGRNPVTNYIVADICSGGTSNPKEGWNDSPAKFTGIHYISGGIGSPFEIFD